MRESARHPRNSPLRACVCVCSSVWTLGCAFVVRSPRTNNHPKHKYKCIIKIPLRFLFATEIDTFKRLEQNKLTWNILLYLYDVQYQVNQLPEKAFQSVRPRCHVSEGRASGHAPKPIFGPVFCLDTLARALPSGQGSGPAARCLACPAQLKAVM